MARIRDHLAAERTFLAWLRTSANVMIVGLVVARFGAGGTVTVGTLGAGGILLLTGAVGVVFGTVRFRSVSRDLEAGRFIVSRGVNGPTWAAFILLAAVITAMVVLLLDGTR